MSTFKLFTLFLLTAIQAAAAPMDAELKSESQEIAPGKSFWVAIDYSLENGAHTYWKNPGDSGMPLSVEWKLPQGFQVSQVLWPTPKRFEQDTLITFGYDAPFTLLAEIIAPKNFEGPVELQAMLEWISCSQEGCVPGEKTVSLTLEKGDGRPNSHNIVFENARKNLPQKSSIEVASQHDELICLTLPHEGTHVEFFPENPECFDPRLGAVVEGKTAVLKTAGCYPQRLKGVLVLDNASYEVDLPLQATKSCKIADASIDKNINGPMENQQDPFLSLGWALVFAFFGGLILNCMPCVLPVISLKVMSFVKMAGQSQKTLFYHSASFVMGVLLSFWILAGTLILLKSWGHAVGWGFQLQDPLFVAILASILFVFSLSLFGVFALGTGIAAQAGGQGQSKPESITASFFSGVLATAVATPCTGPLMGPALGAALTMPAISSLTIFTSLGIGMALPYILLPFFPSLLQLIPKPGNWMIRFKEVMGFVLMASTLWLVWVFGAQTGANALAALLAGFFFFSIACWVFGTWSTPDKRKGVRQIAAVLTVLIFTLGGSLLWQASLPAHSDEWEPFDPDRIQTLQSQGVPVFVDFTASWCLTCQANHLTLSTAKVSDEMKKRGVVRMKADWTNKNGTIAKELEKHGRSGVPLYVLYGRDNKGPAILPQTLTPQTVIDSLDAKIPTQVN